jgi:hypothetical protein
MDSMDSTIAVWGICYGVTVCILLVQGLYFAAFVAGLILYAGMCITGN